MPGPVTPRAAPARFEGGFRIGGLGEVAIRCRDLDAMEAFYADVIGLERMAVRSGGIVFFRIADGVAGHTTVLALFDAGAAQRPAHPGPVEGEAVVTGGRSSLHHLALSLTEAEQRAAIAWYQRIGQPYRIEAFDWVGWRGVFTQDPEGNTVELVAAVGKPEE
ncbi:MAG: VOC family protein [Pseudomonadota bacterium]